MDTFRIKNYFGVDELLSGENWEKVWSHCNELLQQDVYSVQEIIKRSNVKVICTTDDPTDDLHYHEQIAQSDFPVKVLPTFRPDKVLEINKETFVPFVKLLGEVTGKTITTFDELKML